MSKRRLENADACTVPLLLDWLWPIATHVNTARPGDVFAFMRLCHTAYAAMNAALDQWASLFVTLPMDKIVRRIDIYCRQYSRCNFIPAPCDRRLPGHGMVLYYMWRIARLESKHKIGNTRKPNTLVKSLCDDVVSAYVLLENIFYYNDTTGQVCNMLELDVTLKAIDIGKSSEDVDERFEMHLEKCTRYIEADHDLLRDGWSVRDRWSADPKNRVHDYALMRDTLKHYQPTGKTHAIDLIVNGEHINHDDNQQLRNRLFITDYTDVTSPMHRCACLYIELSETAKTRFYELVSRLHDTAKLDTYMLDGSASSSSSSESEEDALVDNE
jgi:hypothetical protein